MIWHPRVPEPEVCRARVARLRDAEWSILALFAAGFAPKEVAVARRVSIHTVRRQIEGIHRTLDVDTVQQAFAILRRAGELEVDKLEATA